MSQRSRKRGLGALLAGAAAMTLAVLLGSATAMADPDEQFSACGQQPDQLLFLNPIEDCAFPTPSVSSLNAQSNSAQRNFDALQSQILSGGGPFLVFGASPKGRFAHTEHDGFKGRLNPTFRTPDYEEDEITVLGTVAVDLTKRFVKNPNRTWKVGVFGGFDHIDVKLGTTPALLATTGLNSAGDAENDSWVVGAFSLMTWKSWYMLSIYSFNFGETDVNNRVLGSSADYDTFGYVTGTAIGRVFTLGQRPGGYKDPTPSRALKADVRVGYSYSHFEGDAYTDTIGVRIGDSEIESWNGHASITFFSEINKGHSVWKPFVKLGVKHRFEYDNKIKIPGQTVNGATFNDFRLTFEDNDTFGNIEGGLVIAKAKSQINLSTYYETNGDADTIGGRLGVTWKLN